MARENVMLRQYDEAFSCPSCGAAMRKLPSLFATDVCGSTQYSQALDIEYTSTRDRERQMKRLGFEPAGDKVHGAREWYPSAPDVKVDKSKARVEIGS